MHLTVENYRGIKSASITLNPKVTLIAGCVGAGKTSVIEALQCLVTGEKRINAICEKIGYPPLCTND